MSWRHNWRSADTKPWWRARARHSSAWGRRPTRCVPKIPRICGGWRRRRERLREPCTCGRWTRGRRAPAVHWKKPWFWVAAAPCIWPRRCWRRRRKPVCGWTRGAQAIGQEPLAVEQSAVWGLGLVMGQEHPDLRGACVDLDPAHANEAAATLRDEVLLRSEERRVGKECRSR